MPAKAFSNFSYALGFGLVLALGFWLRMVHIEHRPMHGDEANQTHRFEILLESKRYHYEPIDFHGPSLYYLTLPVFKLYGITDFKASTKTHFRLITVLFSMLTALGCLLFIDILGRAGSLALSFFIMVSPAMVYYSTYYIQESLLVCFSFFFIATLYRWTQSSKLIWAILCGVCLGLMHATKETFIITLFALGVSLTYLLKNSESKLSSQPWLRHGFLSLLTAGFISILFYSAFFSDASGPLNSVVAYQHHVARGLGNREFEAHSTSGIAHAKPFHYYLSTLIGNYSQKLSSTFKAILHNSPARPITEIFLLLLPFLGFCNLPKPSKERHVFVAAFLFSISQLLIYSIIPYKTPWCMLSFMLGFMFLGALSIKFALNNSSRPSHLLCLLISLLFCVDLSRQAYLINTEEFCVTDKNPYAYVQPYFDVENLSQRIEKISMLTAQYHDMPIHFLTPDYWPMPWYLKAFHNIGYWEQRLPEFKLSQLPIVITTPDREELIQTLKPTHTSEYRGRMPGYSWLVFYRNDLWNKLNNTP